MLIVRKGPTSHLPLHRQTDTRHHQTDTIEIPPTEILGRIFTITEQAWVHLRPVFFLSHFRSQKGTEGLIHSNDKERMLCHAYAAKLTRTMLCQPLKVLWGDSSLVLFFSATSPCRNLVLPSPEPQFSGVAQSIKNKNRWSQKLFELEFPNSQDSGTPLNH